MSCDAVPVVQETWARDLDSVVYYSDVEDANFSTVYSGLPNTEVGVLIFVRIYLWVCIIFMCWANNEIYNSGIFKFYFINFDSRKSISYYAVL